MNIEIETDKRINIYALWEGKQIILCKKQDKFSDINGGKWICLWPSTSDALKMLARTEPKEKTEFLPSDAGWNYFSQISGNDKRNSYIANVEYVPIDGKKRKLWEDLKAVKEFVLWDIDKGPMKYFENKGKQYLAIYQVFEINFSMGKADTVKDKWGNLSTFNKKVNESFSKNIIDNFEQKRPVIPAEDFYKRKNLILEIAKKYPPELGVRGYIRKKLPQASHEIALGPIDPNIKFCINCGTKLIMKAKFCHACGEKQVTP